MNQIIATIVQIVFVLAIAPFAMGLVRFFKARLQGRKGASPFLPYVSFATLFKKQMVMPKAASWVFRAVPFVVFLSSAYLVFVLPLLVTGGIFSSYSDFVLVAGMLILGAIFLVLGGLDPGSAFGGMGSSREMTLAALVEPTFIMAFATIAFVSHSFSIDGMVGGVSIVTHSFLILSIFALILVALAENARYPVDNPATHLELTMVHEAMVLEYSGPYLAMLEYASAIKLTVFSLLIAALVFPIGIFPAGALGMSALLVSIFYGIVKIIVAMALLALLESTIAKMRFYRMSEYLSIAFASAFFGLIITIFASFSKLNADYSSLFSIASIFFVVLLFGRARFQAALRYYALSSLTIGGIAYGLSLVSPEEEKTHLLIFAVVTIVVKTFLVPYVISFAQRQYKYFMSPSSFLRPASSYVLAIAILVGSFFAIKNIPVLSQTTSESMLYASVAMILLGLAMMVVHRNIFSQIIGLLVIENGIAIFTLVTVKSLPLAVELGVFVVTALTAVILASLSFRIRTFIGSADTEKLRSLTE